MEDNKKVINENITEDENLTEDGNLKTKAEIKVGVYDIRAIQEMYNLLNKIQIVGVEQAEIISTIAKYLCSPIKEDVMMLDTSK